MSSTTTTTTATSLESIGFTMVGAGSMCLLSFAVFGCAVRTRASWWIAPRATARPDAVVYNPSSSDIQYRGNPWTGWIPWTLSLDYSTLLRGVPGTGTRKNGKEGSLLQVNLDGIVLLRFHALGLRVSALATVLCICVLMPLYWTGGCYEDADYLGGCVAYTSGNNDPSSSVIILNTEPNQTETPSSSPGLTNYERTTIANLPADLRSGVNDLISAEVAGLRARFYAIVLTFWVLIAYTCWLLRKEWMEVLAMRRVYYLEQDVWGSRKQELQQTLLYKQTNHGSKSTASGETQKGYLPNRQASMDDYDHGEKHLIHRDPWIPHPEVRSLLFCTLFFWYCALCFCCSHFLCLIFFCCYSFTVFLVSCTQSITISLICYFIYSPAIRCPALNSTVSSSVDCRRFRINKNHPPTIQRGNNNSSLANDNRSIGNLI